MTTTIYLLRHASTTPSPHYAPEFDWPLDPRGRLQAEQLAPLLLGLGVDAVLSSSHRRMVETIEPFCNSAGIQMELLEELRESECNRVWQDDFDALIRKYWTDFDYSLPGCESHRACQKRFVGSLLRLATEHLDRTLVCCSGGQAIGLALHNADPSFGYNDWARIGRPDLFRLDSDGKHLQWDRSFTFPGLDGASSD